MPLYRAGLDPADRASCKSLFLLTDKPVLAVVNLGEDQLDQADDCAGAVASALAGHGEALGVCLQLEAEASRLAPEERAELLEGLGLGAGALDPGGPARLPFARAARLLDDRRQGVARLELPGRCQRRGVRGGHPLRSPTGLHQGRGHPLGRAHRDRLVGGGEVRGTHPPRGQGLRGRSTATCSRSDSTCDGAGASVTSTTWLLPRRHGARQCGDRRHLRRAGAAGSWGDRGTKGPSSCPTPDRSTPWACVSPSTSPSSTGSCACSTSSVWFPGACRCRARRARMVLEAEAGAFERWGLRTGDKLELDDGRPR